MREKVLFPLQKSRHRDPCGRRRRGNAAASSSRGNSKIFCQSPESFVLQQIPRHCCRVQIFAIFCHRYYIDWSWISKLQCGDNLFQCSKDPINMNIVSAFIKISMSKLRNCLCVVSCCSKVGYISVFLRERERAGSGGRAGTGAGGCWLMLLLFPVQGVLSPAPPAAFQPRPQVCPAPGILAPSLSSSSVSIFLQR